MDHLKYAPALPADIRLGWALPGTNTLAYDSSKFSSSSLMLLTNKLECLSVESFFSQVYNLRVRVEPNSVEHFTVAIIIVGF